LYTIWPTTASFISGAVVYQGSVGSDGVSCFDRQLKDAAELAQLRGADDVDGRDERRGSEAGRAQERIGRGGAVRGVPGAGDGHVQGRDQGERGRRRAAQAARGRGGRGRGRERREHLRREGVAELEEDDAERWNLVLGGGR
jgi:hypothetical protein